ncbi:hypothetical protein CNY89_29845, partial [Amaricoccus sp. HAR-UPW-R2A-40]
AEGVQTPVAMALFRRYWQEGADISDPAVLTEVAHRLLRWAEAEGVQTPVAMALFRRYWQEGADISDPAVLTEVA